MSSKLVVVLLCLGCLGSPVAASPSQPTAATPGDQATSAEPIDVRYEIHRTPRDTGQVRVKAVVDVPTTVTQLTVRLPDGARFHDYSGLDATGTRWEWDGTSETVTLTYTAPVGLETSFGQRTADTDEWTLVVREEVALRAQWHWANGTDPRWNETMVPAPGSPGVGSPSVAYLGPYATATRETDAGSITLVVPRAATLTAPTAAVLETLETAQRGPTVGPAPGDLTVFVSPESLAPGGYTPANGVPAVVVNAREPVDRPTNVWVHEYYHTRQTFTTDAEMTWLTEGSAEYYAAAVTLRTGAIDYDRFRARVTTRRYQTADLTRPDRWVDPAVPYDKGVRVVATLDAWIRQATGYERSFDDVLSKLAQRDDAVTLASFLAAVSTVAGEPLNELVLEAITGPVPPVPDEPHAVTERGTADPDGDGLDNAAEWRYGSHPFRADTDGDGVTDGAELQRGTDPVVAGGPRDTVLSRVAPRRTPQRYEPPSARRPVAGASGERIASSTPDTGRDARSVRYVSRSPPLALWATVVAALAGLGLWWRRDG